MREGVVVWIKEEGQPAVTCGCALRFDKHLPIWQEHRIAILDISEIGRINRDTPRSAGGVVDLDLSGSVAMLAACDKHIAILEHRG